MVKFMVHFIVLKLSTPSITNEVENEDKLLCILFLTLILFYFYFFVLHKMEYDKDPVGTFFFIKQLHFIVFFADRS